MTDHPVADRIREKLEVALSPELLDIIDESMKHAKHAHMMERPGTAGEPGETHLRIRIVSARFQGVTRIDRHRTINALLADEMGPNKLHAVAIEARSPSEIEARAPSEVEARGPGVTGSSAAR